MTNREMTSCDGDSGDRVALVCPTCDRPAALDAALRSYAADERRSGERCDLIVGDNSIDRENRRRNTNILQRLDRTGGGPTYYAGIDEKTRFAAELAGAAAVDAEIIDFALFDSLGTGLATTGANYNALLIHSVGSLVLAFDDDTVCRPAQLPSVRPGYRALDNGDGLVPCWPAELWTFDDLGAAWRHVRTDSGRSAVRAQCEILRGAVSSAAREGTAAGDAASPPPPKVRVVLPGLVGDCGWASPSLFLFLTGNSLTRLVEDQQAYAAACTRRTVVKSVECLTLVPRCQNMMCMFFGVDNRDLVPPFLPVGRGTDHLWGTLVSACHPGEYFAHLPLLLCHDPRETRRFWSGEIVRSMSGIETAYVLSALVRAWDPPPDGRPTSADRMAALGAFLESTATATAAAFSRRIVDTIAIEWTSTVRGLDARLATHGATAPWWRDDVTRATSLFQQSLDRKDFACPLDLRIRHDAASGLAALQRITRMFGRLLQVWPRVWHASARLAVSGHHLGANVAASPRPPRL
jgi:hypothetical protein